MVSEGLAGGHRMLPRDGFTTLVRIQDATVELWLRTPSAAFFTVPIRSTAGARPRAVSSYLLHAMDSQETQW